MRKLLVALLPTLLIASSCTVNPVTGRMQLDLLGEQQEIELGTKLYPRYTQLSLGEVPDLNLQVYVQEVGSKLAGVSHRPHLDFRFNVVGEPDANAWALPGGKISITRGLLSRLENEDQLACVLGHEVGHVAARHAAEQYTRGVLFQLALLGGAAYVEAKKVKHGEWYILGGVIAGQLAFAKYSRDDERQADALGMEYAARAGYDPAAAVEVMEILAGLREREPTLVERMFASHPQPQERIANAKRWVSEHRGQYTLKPGRGARFRSVTRMLRLQRDAYDLLAKARKELNNDRPSSAANLMRQAVSSWPDDGILRCYLALAEAGTGDVSSALRDAAKAAADASAVFHPQYVAGVVFEKAHRWNEALSYLLAADKLVPEHPGVEFHIAEAYQALGRYSEAIQHYRKVRAIAPGSELASKAEERLRALNAL